MKRRLKWIGPLKFGIIAGILQAILSLMIIPFFLIGIVASSFAPHTETSQGLPFVLGLGGGLLVCVILPFVYAVLGFIFGCLTALVYNLVAKMTGGIEFEVE